MNLLWMLHHDDKSYYALVSKTGCKSPRSYVPKELRRHLQAGFVGPTNKPEGLLFSGTRDGLIAYMREHRPHKTPEEV